MRRSPKTSVRLEAYRQIYSAVCSLSDSLYDKALAVAESEGDAAFAASCALVARLEGTPAGKQGLLRRIEALPRACASAKRSTLAASP